MIYIGISFFCISVAACLIGYQWGQHDGARHVMQAIYYASQEKNPSLDFAVVYGAGAEQWEYSPDLYCHRNTQGNGYCWK